MASERQALAWIFPVLLATTALAYQVVIREQTFVPCEDMEKCGGHCTSCQVELEGGNATGCCPWEGAVCCSAGNCCPPEFTCHVGATCMTQYGQIWGNAVPAVVQPHQLLGPFRKLLAAVSFFHHHKEGSHRCSADANFTCPDSATCCTIPSGSFGCCPHPNAACCPDQVHCCPQGEVCADSSCKKATTDLKP